MALLAPLSLAQGVSEDSNIYMAYLHINGHINLCLNRHLNCHYVKIRPQIVTARTRLDQSIIFRKSVSPWLPVLPPPVQPSAIRGMQPNAIEGNAAQWYTMVTQCHSSQCLSKGILTREMESS